MSKSTDFSNMTLDELTPIVSMRPGKEYSREELQMARAAFMAALEKGASADDFSTEEPTSPAEPAIDIPMAETQATAENIEALHTDSISEPVSAPQPELPPIEDSANALPPLPPISPGPVFSPVSSEPQHTEAETEPIEEFDTTGDYVSFPVVPITPASDNAAPLSEQAEAVPDNSPMEDEEFILKTESRLARLLYILYAYLFLPLLAVEALLFLVAGVLTAVSVPDIPFLLLQILCTAVYTMIVTFAWHQLLFRTHLGLILNRSLIVVCIVRGLGMLFSSESVLPGIIMLALSALFLVFFVAYDNTFTVKSPNKRRAR